ncbi:MAG: TRAP transporter small permease [Pseudomonadota bacterium]
MERLALWAGRVLAWAFPVIALMMGYEVIARYAFGAPTFWAHEIAGLIAATAFIFGGAYCMAEKSHMRVTLLTERLGPRAARAFEALALSCGIIFLTGLAVAMWGIVERSALKFAADGTWTPERSGTSWNTISPALLKVALLVGALLFLAVVIRQAIALLRR